MAYDLGTAEGKIVIDSSGVDGAVAGANQSLGKLGGKGSGFNAAEFGSAMTLGVTAPILAVGGAALKTAIDFETAFAGVEKTMDATPQQLEAIKQGIIDMSKEIPASTTEIASVAEAAGQLGIAADDALDFTRVMIDLGNATNLTADDAAVNIARIQNIMGSGVDTVDNFGAALVALGNNSATTEAEIVEMANRLAGVAAQSDITEDSMLAIAATMSSVGVRAEAGGTSITRTIKDFDSWSRQIQEANAAGEELDGTLAVFQSLVGDIDEFSNLSGDQQLLKFVQALQQVEAEGGNVLAVLEDMEITQIRQSDTLLKLVGSGDLLTESLALGAEAWDENSALTEETSKRYETTAAQLEIAKNNAIDIARVLGEALIPVLKDMTTIGLEVAGIIGTMAEWFAKLPEPVRKFAAAALLALAAIGPIFFVGAKVVKTVKTISTAFKALGIAFKGLGLIMAANPFVLIILAVIALVAGLVILYKRSEKFRKLVKKLGKAIEKAFKAVVDFFKGLPKFFEDLWDDITDAFEGAKDAVVDAWNGVIDFFKDLADKIGDALSEAWDAVVDFVTELPGMIADGLGEALDAVVDFLTKLPERFAYFLGLVIGSYIKFQLNLITKVIETGVAVVTEVIGFLSKLPGIVIEWTTKVVTEWVKFQVDLYSKLVSWATEFISFLISKFTEFLTWLPGFIADVIAAIAGWAADMVARAIQMGIDFVNGVIGQVLALPGNLWNILTDTVSTVINSGPEFVSAALGIGGDLVTGFFDGIGDIAGLLWDVINNAISGIGSLGQAAYDKAKSIGSSFWGGIKSGLGINSPSYVEEAFFAMEANVGKSIGVMADHVRQVHGLSRRIPDLASQTTPLAASTALGASSSLRSASGGASGQAGGGLTVEGPLLAVENFEGTPEEILETSRKLADLTYKQLEAQGKRADRVNGTFNATG